MKKYIATIIAVSTLLALAWGMSAQAATSGNGAVTFSVQATQSLTAQAIGLGTLSAGTTTQDKNPVTLSSNVAWNVTGIAGGDFTDGASPTPTTLAIGSLTMGGATMVKTAPAVAIASGAAGSSQSPTISTALTVPWDRADLVSKNMSATITYTITP